MNREYAGEVLVPSGWYLPHKKEAHEKALQLIEYAGKELVKERAISPDLSSQIGSLITRKEIVKAMNSYYGKFE